MKQCAFCKEVNINHLRDNHFRFIGYDKGQKGKTLFYHVECWKGLWGEMKEKHYNMAQKRGLDLVKRFMRKVKNE